MRYTHNDTDLYLTYPLPTHSGWAFAPAIATDGTSCDHCSRLAECRNQVLLHDGFALCESVIPADLLTEEEAVVIIRNEIRAQRPLSGISGRKHASVQRTPHVLQPVSAAQNVS